jgi:hypothetical protein
MGEQVLNLRTLSFARDRLRMITVPAKLKCTHKVIPNFPQFHMVFLNPSPLQYSRSLKSVEFGGPGVNLLGMGIRKHREFLHSLILNTQDWASAKIMVL